ncbi:hypothetical protein SNEBB_011271 [Seison nebaliae]|nr:hypothetical protein SNEBB_011271 [Seison nebaliae]
MFKNLFYLSLPILCYLLIDSQILFQKLEEKYGENCGQVEGKYLDGSKAIIRNGSEDVEMIDDEIFITNGLNIKIFMAMDFSLNDGKIFHIKKTEKGEWSSEAEELGDCENGKSFDDLNPHGLSLYHSSEGKIIIGVVNHQLLNEAITIFQYDKSKTCLSKIKNIPMIGKGILNDLVFLNENEILVTEMLTSRKQPDMLIETIRGQSISKVYKIKLYGNKEVETFLSDLPSPNGIQIDRKRNLLFLAIGNKMNVYNLKDDKLLSSTTVDGIIDNINIYKQSVLLGLHTSVIRFLHYELTKNVKVTPGILVELSVNNQGEVTSSKDLFITNGERLSAISCGLIDGETMFIGSVRHELLKCSLK